MKYVFSLKNLIKEPTCFKSQNSTLLDLILTDRHRSFIKSQNLETGVSDVIKSFIVLEVFFDLFKKLLLKIIKFRDQEQFDQKKFLQDLDCQILRGDLYRNCDEPYEKLSEIFTDILNHHTPLKQKQIKSNHA